MARLSAISVAVALLSSSASAAPSQAPKIPALAQVVDQKSFNVLKQVPEATEQNGSSPPWTPPGLTADALTAKPFHIYDNEFLDIIGDLRDWTMKR